MPISTGPCWRVGMRGSMGVLHRLHSKVCLSHTAAMTTVAELLVLPAGSALALLAGSAAVSPTRVALVERRDRLEQEPAGTLALLTAAGSRELAGYLLDVTLRRATTAGLAGLVLVDPEPLPLTALAIARRGGIAVLGAAGDTDLAALAAGIARELSGVEEGALVRAVQALRAIDAAELAGA